MKLHLNGYFSANKMGIQRLNERLLNFNLFKDNIKRFEGYFNVTKMIIHD